MQRDADLPEEPFLRVVGKRRHPPTGEPPPASTRQALDAMARYLTRAPKGVFVYPDHESANRARDAWTVAAMVAKKEHG